jgi:hypothetical protein
MVTAGTIEEQIQKLHATKRDLAQSVLTGSDSSAVNSADSVVATWCGFGMMTNQLVRTSFSN